MVEQTHLLIHGQVESWVVLGILAKANADLFDYDASHYEDCSRLQLVSGSLDLYDLYLTACRNREKVNKIDRVRDLPS